MKSLESPSGPAPGIRQSRVSLVRAVRIYRD